LQPVNQDGEHVPAIAGRMFTRGDKKNRKATQSHSHWSSHSSTSGSRGYHGAASASADHGNVRWSAISEQAFSEMPLVSGYKAQVGRAPFYSNYDTVTELLGLVDASVSTKVSPRETVSYPPD